MQILNPDIDRYLDSLVPSRSAVFHQMEKRAQQNGFPHVGPQVGSLLLLLATMTNARSIIELGSGFGYSAA